MMTLPEKIIGIKKPSRAALKENILKSISEIDGLLLVYDIPSARSEIEQLVIMIQEDGEK
jgi:hypothetical protein